MACVLKVQCSYVSHIRKSGVDIALIATVMFMYA